MEVILALAIGVGLDRMKVHRDFVPAVGKLACGCRHHAVVEQGDPVQEIGDQVLVLRSSLRSQIRNQFPGVGVGRLLKPDPVQPGA